MKFPKTPFGIIFQGMDIGLNRPSIRFVTVSTAHSSDRSQIERSFSMMSLCSSFLPKTIVNTQWPDQLLQKYSFLRVQTMFQRSSIDIDRCPHLRSHISSAEKCLVNGISRVFFDMGLNPKVVLDTGTLSIWRYDPAILSKDVLK